MKIKNTHISFSLLILILSLALIGSVNQSFTPQIKHKTPKTSDGEVTIITPENKTYTSPDSGYYPATYGFENNKIGEAPSDWVIYPMDASSYIEVDQHLDGHNYVVEQRKNGGTMRANMVKRFDSNATVGSVEFWFYKDTDSGTDSTRLYILGDTGDGDGRFEYGFTNGDLHHGFWNTRTVVATNILTKNTWHYIKVEFDVLQGCQILVDGVLYGAGYAYPFLDNPTIINGFKMCSLFSGGNPNYGAWIDAVGFSWDPNYNIGDNLNEGLLLSYDNTTTLNWQGYSLDGVNNKTIVGNTTIPMPADGHHKIQVFGNDSVGTLYESNVRWFTVYKNIYINIVTPKDKIYTEPDNGYFYGTHGFECDKAGELPLEFEVLHSPDSAGFIEIDEELAGHKKVCELRKAGGLNAAYIITEFVENVSSGTIELWMYKDTDSSTDISQIYLQQTGIGNVAVLGIVNGDLYHHSWGSRTYVAYDVFSKNIWHHIRIDFDVSLGWQFALDGVWYGLGYSYSIESPAVTEISNSHIGTGFSAVNPNYGTWIDAFGYSWNPNYNIGDNINEGLLLSYENTTNLDWQGYSLDGQSNKTILGNKTIAMPNDGQHHIQVYGNDSIGNIYGSEIRYFDVDANPVDITINSPTNYELFQDIAPNFEISLDDPDLNSTWYSLDSGITNIPFMGFTGTIEQSEWNKFSNGTVTIGFYANDSVNHISYASVTVRKDVLGPIITVNSPQVNEVFGVIAPYYDLSIVEHSLDSIWYSFDYGVTVFPLFSLTGTLDQAEWETKGGGTVPIRFYANDSLGHESFIDVTIIKDLILPLITINSPGAGEVFGDSPPDYDISITESNLDSYWYTIDSGATNISISSLSGTIDQMEWATLGNGIVTIRFYAEDEGGNKGFAEIIVRKDINIPLITINSPITTDILGLQPPQYDISVVEPNIDAMWYTLDSGASNVTFSSLTGTIDQTEWNKFGDGIVNIRFYIRDEGGNEAFAEVSVNKDLIAPVVTINEPELGDIFVDYPPIYSISIDEPHSYVFWYSLDGGVHNYSIIELTSAISQASWDAIPNGHVTLRFYAEDEAGNIGQSSITITKRTTPGPTPPGIPGYNIIALIGVTLAVTLILTKRKNKK